MQENKAIPEPIILERVKEALDTLEILHYLKVVVFISNEDRMVKSGFWKTNFLFGHYLFEENVEIFQNLEKLFLSLAYITRAVKGNENLTTENAKKYKLLLYSMFNSCIDLYNVTFEKLEGIR
jgi:16S rRNA C1402 N4-methylase RsmH